MQKKRTFEEKVEQILHTTLPCGCEAHDHGLDGYVVDEHTCDGTVLVQQAHEQRQAKFDSNTESAKRSTATLYNKPFRLLR